MSTVNGMARKVTANLLDAEIDFSASRSDGPGGQNVNKVSSKITMRFDLMNSSLLTEAERQLLLKKIGNRLTKEGVLILSEQGSRSQLQNKENVIVKFNDIIEEAFKPEKIRRKTKPSKSSVEKRKTHKRLQSEKKKWRQRP